MESIEIGNLTWELALLLGTLVVVTPALLLILLKSKRHKTKIESSGTSGTPLGEVDQGHHKSDQRVTAKRKDLKEALKNTKSSLFGRIKTVFVGEKTLGDDEFDELEEILYTSDIGPSTVQKLVESVSKQLESVEKANFEKVRQALKGEMLDLFKKVDESSQRINLIDPEKYSDLQVWMIVGVNGAGKTTTIGKLSSTLSGQGKKVMVVAGDTFRAAAESQLKVWGERAGVEIFSPPGVKDPSAVVFDALNSAKAKGTEIIIIDTAGRLHTQENLMEELKKMKRVMEKVIPNAPQETLIVLDSNSGQNALMQTQKFNESLGLTGAVLTKLDGSAKGGVALGLAAEFQMPIRLIGVGEGIEDLRVFDYSEFVDSII